MFWKKLGKKKQGRGTGPRKAQAAPPPPLDPDLADQAIDALAAVLRSYGEQAFDLDGTEAAQVTEDCERWARHILVGAPATPQHELVEPAEGDPAAEAGSGDSTPFRRDFGGLQRFVGSHRWREKQYVTKSLSDFSQAIWSMVQALRFAVTEDRSGDAKASTHLRQLASALEGRSTERIKREANECVRVVGDLLEERKRRQHAQVDALGQRLDSIRDELEAVREQSTRDPLTDLFNRAAFDEQIARLADMGFLLSRGFFLLMIDIDHFKWVNDNFGHPCGDAVLRETSAAIASCFMRREDFAARYGGDEFAVLIRDDSVEAARDLAERVLYAVRDLEIEHEGEAIRVAISLGAAQLSPGESPESWLQRADAALYQAKQGGRDRAVFDEPTPAD